MKKKSIVLLLGLLIALGGFFFSEKFGEAKKEVGEAVIPLEKIDAKSIDRWNQSQGFLQFSPNGKYLVVVSEGGKIRIIEIKSKDIVYQKSLGIGFFKVVAFSADSKYLYLGESSPDGYLYCLSLPKGKKIWQYRTADDLNSNLAKESYPGINSIAVDKKGMVYFTAGRSEKHGRENRSYSARVYALDGQSGQILWKFPQKENLDTNSYWLDVQGKYVACNTMDLNNEQKEKYPGGTIYFLTSKDGKAIWQYTFPTVYPFKKTAIWYNPVISPDGKYVGALTSDGRGYLFSNQGKLLWERNISTPKEVGGMPIYATGTHCYFIGNKLLFSTTNTFDASKSKYNLPVEHPNSNSVFAYDLQGNLSWKWRAGGYMEQENFSKDGGYMICPVSKNFRTKDLSVHGVYLLDISNPADIKIVKTYKPKTKGPIISADMSADGKYIAALETPVLMSDDVTTVGKYQVHIWSR